MLQGLCTDNSQSMILQEGKTYYLFPNGKSHFYVSKFPNSHAHMGCFDKELFQILNNEENEPEKIQVSLDTEKVYKAKLIWRRPGYKQTELKEYYVKPNITHGYFYHDVELTRFGGSFPLHWFSEFKEWDSEVEVEVEERLLEPEIEFAEQPPIEESMFFEQLELF